MIKLKKISDQKYSEDLHNKNIIFHNYKGQDIIRHFSKIAPKKSGVYQMESKNGEILYIGKAKNLSNRLKNYSSINNLTRRLQRMVGLTKNVNVFVTNTEIEALLLECNFKFLKYLFEKAI